MSARLLGAVCVAFAAGVFVYFTAWTFGAPFSPALRAHFPPRAVLLLLPPAGAATLAAGAAAFVAVVSARARAAKAAACAR